MFVAIDCFVSGHGIVPLIAFHPISQRNFSKLAFENMQKKVGKNMADKANEAAREGFKDWLDGGGKLTYGQLKKVNSVWRKDYHTAMVKESDQMKEYMNYI